MKIISAAVLLWMIWSCNKPGDNNVINCDPFVNIVSFPNNHNGQKELYYYNPDNTLAKKLYYYDSVTISRADTFYYSAGKLIRSSYSLNGINFNAPYAYTEWSYTGDKLASSKYYLRAGGGNYTVYTNTIYQTDDSGRIVLAEQIQGVNAEKMRFEYDTSSNLRKVFIQFNNDPESLFDEFFDFDNAINPYYKHPLEFDYDIYIYNTFQFSKHNYRRHNRGSNSGTYTITYYTDGKVKGIKDANVNPDVVERSFGWECK